MLAIYDRLATTLSRLAPETMPTLARATFAGVLLIYFWNSARTKLGAGPFGLFMPSDGAYIQIFPKTVEAVSYDTSQLGVLHWVVAVAGTSAELFLPLLILLGLFTRLAALGMIGFIVVQSITDVVGHGVGDGDLGRWFDAMSGSLILDQRSLWVLLLVALVFMGAGPLSLDRLLLRLRGITAGSLQVS